jgi:hypothetical protein
MDAEIKAKIAKNQARLKTIFKYTDKDLEYNRRGQLSPNQKAVLNSAMMAKIVGWAVFALGGAIFMVLVLVNIYDHYRTTRIDLDNAISALDGARREYQYYTYWGGFALTGFGVMLAGLFNLGKSMGDRNTDVSPTNLMTTNGMVFKAETTFRVTDKGEVIENRNQVKFNLGSYVAVINPTQRSGFEEKTEYVVYFLKRTNMIVSVEVVPPKEKVEVQEEELDPWARVWRQNDADENDSSSAQQVQFASGIVMPTLAAGDSRAQLIYRVVMRQNTYSGAVEWVGSGGGAQKLWEQRQDHVEVLNQNAKFAIKELMPHLKDKGWRLTKQVIEGELQKNHDVQRSIAYMQKPDQRAITTDMPPQRRQKMVQ